MAQFNDPKANRISKLDPGAFNYKSYNTAQSILHALSKKGYSTVAIAGMLSVSRKTVWNLFQGLRTNGQTYKDVLELGKILFPENSRHEAVKAKIWEKVKAEYAKKDVDTDEVFLIRVLLWILRVGVIVLAFTLTYDLIVGKII